ncbi:hypothetical protein B0H14DRAFT_2700166 [Mycena olivaceomarginata]|nr:hypothetical protein B0H14DRAFT_2700166 [Mycena olivaceomarginata]
MGLHSESTAQTTHDTATETSGSPAVTNGHRSSDRSADAVDDPSLEVYGPTDRRAPVTPVGPTSESMPASLCRMPATILTPASSPINPASIGPALAGWECDGACGRRHPNPGVPSRSFGPYSSFGAAHDNIPVTAPVGASFNVDFRSDGLGYYDMPYPVGDRRTGYSPAEVSGEWPIANEPYIQNPGVDDSETASVESLEEMASHGASDASSLRTHLHLPDDPSSSGNGSAQQIVSPDFYHDEVSGLGAALNIGDLTVFRDSYVHRSVSLSSSEEARANFKDMDNSVLQCVAYQCRPQFPAMQYIIPALGAITDMSFDFVDSGYARNPARPNWMDLQLRTRTSQMAPKMMQILWILSMLLSSSGRSESFTAIHHIRETSNALQIPIYSLRPGNKALSFSSTQWLESQFDLEANRPFIRQILDFRKEKLRDAMCDAVEDWLWVFLALLEHFSMEERLTVVDAYRQYFLCLADVEMNAALHAGFPAFQDSEGIHNQTDMRQFADTSTNDMFYSIVKRVGGVLINIPTTDELQFARNFGHVMHLWAYGSYSMEDAVHKKQEEYFFPRISLARTSLAQMMTNIIIPGFIPQHFAQQLPSPRRPFRLVLADAARLLNSS